MLAVLTLVLALGAVQPFGSNFSSAEVGARMPGNAKPALVCRREAETGSIIKTRKMCLTRAEWAQRSDDAQCETRRMLNLGAGQARLEC